jgi:hypothetical protein
MRDYNGTIEEQMHYLRGRAAACRKEVISTARDHRKSVQALEFYEKEMAELRSKDRPGK